MGTQPGSLRTTDQNRPLCLRNAAAFALLFRLAYDLGIGTAGLL
ncbi:hypothetical protein [Streptomyces sp. NPDC005009]